MTPIERIRVAIPGFTDAAPLARSLKCAVLAGVFDGRVAVAKVLDHDDPVWRWYFEREAEVLARVPVAAAAPTLIAADLDAGILVLERVTGQPMARGRRVGAARGDVIDAVLALSASLSAWTDAGELERPPAPVRAVMRKRLLEDPGAPMAWLTEGISRCAALGIVSDRDAARVKGALARDATVAPQHGDLLPRNIVLEGDRARLIDWECAGLHARDWDRALLWASLPADGRARVEACIGKDGDRVAAFRALTAFALAREVKFARKAGSLRRRLEADLLAALASISST